jgi:hypothetical protein
MRAARTAVTVEQDLAREAAGPTAVPVPIARVG